MSIERDAFDAALIPHMRTRLADAYREFRIREAELIAYMVPPSHGGSVGAYQTRDCPNCGDASVEAEWVISSNGLTLVRCSRCQMTYSKEVMDERADAGRYQASLLDKATLDLRLSEPYLELETARAQYYLQLIARHISKGCLLEIGSGYGTFLVEAQNLGWQALGLEPGRLAAEAGRRRGANIVNGYFPDDLPDRACIYDTIAILDVLEHIATPLEFLTEVRAQLKPGGILFIQVPNWDSLLVQLEGAASSIITPGHWSYFTPATLQDLLSRADFRALDIATVQSEIDRQLKFDPETIKNILKVLRPEEIEIPGVDRLHELKLGYKLIGVFKREP